MEWIDASKRKPREWEDVIIRHKNSTNELITNVWKFHSNCIELDNDGTVAGREIKFYEVEWLDEPNNKQ